MSAADDRQRAPLERQGGLFQKAPVSSRRPLHRPLSRRDQRHCAREDGARSYRLGARRSQPYRAHGHGRGAGLGEESALIGGTTAGPDPNYTRARVNLAAGAVAACVVALLAACGGTTKQSSIHRATAARLASSSDAVALALRRGDSCGAATQARALRRQVAGAIASGAIPSSLAAPARTASSHLVASIACVPPPSPPPPAEKPNDEKHEGDRGDGNRHHPRHGADTKAKDHK